MAQMLDDSVGVEDFIDRRSPEANPTAPVRERRQFTNSHAELSPDAKELADAIDQYKLHHRRRFITYEEMLGVVLELGYGKGKGRQSDKLRGLTG